MKTNRAIQNNSYKRRPVPVISDVSREKIPFQLRTNRSRDFVERPAATFGRSISGTVSSAFVYCEHTRNLHIIGTKIGSIRVPYVRTGKTITSTITLGRSTVSTVFNVSRETDRFVSEITNCSVSLTVV